MSLIVIPEKGGQDAQLKFQTHIDDPNTVVLIVYGKGAEIDRVLEVALASASVNPAMRRVLWVPDRNALSESQQRAFCRRNAVVVSVGFDDKIAESLSLTKARHRLYVDSAFEAAESSGGAR